jgi:hypothetical protein
MENENKPVDSHVGLYESAVNKITESVKPHLHNVTQEFVAKSVEKYAHGNPRYARMIEFEVRRRGDGAGLTQDVAEPVVWTGIMTVVAAATTLVTKKLENTKFKLLGYGAAIAAGSAAFSQIFQLARLVPRYKAGLQGSLEMAKDRWRSIEETGVDPFNNQQSPREINPGGKPEAEFTQAVKPRAPVMPTSLTEQASKATDTLSASR